MLALRRISKYASKTCCYQVSFLRTWFAQNHVDKFSIALFFKRNDNDLSRGAAFVNNRNCKQSAGFKLGSLNSGVMAGVTTDTEVEVNPAWVNNYCYLNLSSEACLPGVAYYVTLETQCVPCSRNSKSMYIKKS